MKTPQEVADLKSNWSFDPCWDIETTEGFESYAAELLAFRLAEEEEWHNAEQARILKLAERYGIPGNTVLASVLEQLQARVSELEVRIKDADDV